MSLKFIVLGAIMVVCSICKMEGHRADTCQHPAAEEVRKLRAEVRQLRGGAKNTHDDRGKAEREGRKTGECFADTGVMVGMAQVGGFINMG